MKLNYAQLNKVIGWAVFAVALIIFWSTVEPTVSYWDAGEYIATSSKLEVGHPPGAPLYQMMGAVFSIFALEATDIAYCVNLLAVFSSAFTILFMFWSLTLLLKNHILKNKASDVMVLGAAAIGALAFAVTDSFWYNAVEAEVYAPAALLMSVMFYTGLLWERDMLLPRGNRWLILISFIVGLSFGIHFMGILTIPAIGMLWYFKHYKNITAFSFIIANVAVVAILLFVFKLLLPYTLSIFGYLELFFVNDIGLPFNSGSVIALLLIISLFAFLISLSRKRNLPILNTVTICIMFVLIGFSSWTMLPIRANAGTPINENAPEDARSLLAYYNREQYPAPGLFYSEYFTDMYAGYERDDPDTEENEGFNDEKPKYEKDYNLGKYVIVNNYKDAVPNTVDKHKGIFARMTDASRASNYIEFMGGLEYSIKPGYENNQELLSVLDDYERRLQRGTIDAKEYTDVLMSLSEAVEIEKPTFLNNMRYLFNYQINYMYMRYFMWNFAGRQNDVQGEWDSYDGNWLSGITFIDEARLGTQKELSDDMLNNKGRNTYFFLPLILGILGAVFHARKDLKSFYVTLVLFLFTGLAIIIYLNQAMFQVRERDYAYVGSFLVFSMWIGMGVYSIYEMLRDVMASRLAQIISLTACFAAAPLLMGYQNWDDHDRSGKYTALASAKKYLDSCLPNALIFTIGDNDTFPLWYAQEVEGYRTDVRVVCTSLLATDWYMDDMRKKAWKSEPVPSTLTHSKYKYGTRDILYFADKERIQQRMRDLNNNDSYKFPDTMALKDWMEWVASDNKITQEEMRNGHFEHTFPTKFITIPVNKEAVIKNKVVPQKDADKIVDEIVININSNAVYKNRMFMLDIINANNWERPIYFSGGAFSDEDYIWMKDYLQLDGCAYRLLPIKTVPEDPRDPFDMGRVDPDYGYKVIKNWDWGNSGSPDIYHDVETRRNSVGYRSNVTRTAEALTKDGQLEKAEEILDIGMHNLPLKYYENYSMLESFISGYYELGKIEKARKLLDGVIAKYQDELDHYNELTLAEQNANYIKIATAISRYNSIAEVPVYYEDQEMIDKHVKTYNSYFEPFIRFMNEAYYIRLDRENDSTLYPNATEEMELRDLLDQSIDKVNRTRNEIPVDSTNPK
jgi:hypothetical protein